MSQANQVELEMLALINADRADAGLHPLQLNTALNDASEDHSRWMLNTDQFSHTGAGGSNAGARMMETAFPFEGSYQWAENIGWQSERGAPGISDDVADIHESLMNSPGHRANLLDPDLTDIGIGIQQGDFTTSRGTFDAVMVTQNFAATDGDTSALRDPGAGGGAAQDAPLVLSAPAPVAEGAAPPKDAPAMADVAFEAADVFAFVQTRERMFDADRIETFWADLFEAMDAQTEVAISDLMALQDLPAVDLIPDMTFDCV